MPLTPEQTADATALALDFARDGLTEELSGFIDQGIPVDVTDGDGNSLLMLAGYHGQAATVQMLLERGADVNLHNSRDQSVVAGALYKGEDKVVGLLLAAGADLDTGTPTARATAELYGQAHLLPAPS